jgi:hypothetical protein
MKPAAMEAEVERPKAKINSLNENNLLAENDKHLVSQEI